MFLIAVVAGCMTSSFLIGFLFSRVGVGRVLAASCFLTGLPLIVHQTYLPSPDTDAVLSWLVRNVFMTADGQFCFRSCSPESEKEKSLSHCGGLLGTVLDIFMILAFVIGAQHGVVARRVLPSFAH
jgi:hypothetical protein